MSALLAGAAAVVVAVVATSVALVMPPISRPIRRVRHPDLALLQDIGWRRGLIAWEAIRAASAFAALVISLATGLPIILALMGGLAPSLWVRLRGQAARDRSHRATGALVSAVESALRSGTSLPEALRRAADGIGEPIARRPIEAALRSFELGSGLDVALIGSAAQVGDERERDVLMTLALGIEERLPRERLADLLASIADRVAFEDELADEVRARAAGARQQQWLLAGLVPALAIYLAATMPMLGATLASDLGRFVLVPVAVALEIGGIVLSSRVIRGAMP